MVRGKRHAESSKKELKLQRPWSSAKNHWLLALLAYDMRFETSSSSTEKELHVLGGQLLHGNVIVVDCRCDELSLLLLKQNDSRFHGVFDAQASNGTRPLLPYAVTTIG